MISRRGALFFLGGAIAAPVVGKFVCEAVPLPSSIVTMFNRGSVHLPPGASVGTVITVVNNGDHPLPVYGPKDEIIVASGGRVEFFQESTEHGMRWGSRRLNEVLPTYGED